MTRKTVPTWLVLSVLARPASRATYGLEIMDATGLDSGTVYPLLHRLLSAGLVTCEEEIVNPVDAGRPPRKYYQVTEAGRTHLALYPFRWHPLDKTKVKYHMEPTVYYRVEFCKYGEWTFNPLARYDTEEEAGGVRSVIALPRRVVKVTEEVTVLREFPSEGHP